MNKKIRVTLDAWCLAAAVASSIVCSSFGQEIQDPGLARAFNFFCQLKRETQEMRATIEANEQRADEVENRAVQGYLFSEQLSRLNVGVFDESCRRGSDPGEYVAVNMSLCVKSLYDILRTK